MNQRERYEYLNKKYLTSMGKNQVLVMPNQEVKTLDMMPRVSILEDLQFRKALPKSFKYFDKLHPFSEKLGKIKDNTKFMTAVSKDMLKTVIIREAKFFKNQRLDQQRAENQADAEKNVDVVETLLQKSSPKSRIDSPARSENGESQGGIAKTSQEHNDMIALADKAMKDRVGFTDNLI